MRFALVFSLLSAISSFATNVNPTLDGKISTHCLGGSTYQIQLEIVIPGMPVITDSIALDCGDGSDYMISEADYAGLTSSAGMSNLLFLWNHTYSPGNYTVFARCGNHIGGILNVPNSSMLEFCLQAFVMADPNIGCNSSPTSSPLLPQIEWTTQQFNVEALSVIDAEGDSIVWNVYTPLCVQTGTANPALVGGGTFTYSSQQQNFSWSNPMSAGAYTVLFFFEEWHVLPNGNRVLIGNTTREVLLDVNNTVDISTIAQPAFSLYPNPVLDILTVECAEMTTGEILDVHGKVVLAQKLNVGTNRIEVSALAEGQYILKIGTSSQRIAVVR